MSTATIPDVCKTPTPGGPVPMPYPNISQASTLSDGTTTVKVDGNMAAIKGSKFPMSSGDEPGTIGGVKSNTFKQASTWMLYSFDIKLDGQNACRFSDKMFHNNENTINAMGVIPIIVQSELDNVKMKCGELNTYGKQKKKSGKNKRDRDHIPAKSALLAKAKDIAGKRLKPCQAKAIVNGALTIVIPKAAHQQVSPTYGQSAADAEKDSKDLAGSANRDTKAMEKKLKDYDPGCVEAYKAAAKKIRKIKNRQYNAWLKKMLASC
ncbi:MAG TPA: DUF4150 domain-containing protein [Polyangia bacterium]|jgi:uncharacterized Zn-binding protein involved in type VI secretion|nr:DUF4150 domain-containing protein [Polyangia bacterium]